MAAGFSRRLGRPKQTVEISGETLLRRAARVALHAGLKPVIAVLPAQTDFSYTLKGLDCTIVLNDEAEEGLASSIRAGVRAVQAIRDVTGVVIMTCDQVGTRAEHLQALCSVPDRMTGSAYAERVGVPAYFPSESFHDLLALRGDAGARDLLRSAHAIQAEELALDIDTEGDVARAKLLLEQADPTSSAP